MAPGILPTSITLSQHKSDRVATFADFLHVLPAILVHSAPPALRASATTSRASFTPAGSPATPSQLRQQLLLSQPRPPLAAAGLRFAAIAHDGNSQSSAEEGKAVLDVYRSLIGQTFQDRDCKRRNISAADILVVAPYNAEINLLTRMLPDGARVGTVDKFQGQEAAVCLISMATSSADELPRNIEFLFSVNRLNVAISRAQALAVVFASPPAPGCAMPHHRTNAAGQCTGGGRSVRERWVLTLAQAHSFISIAPSLVEHPLEHRILVIQHALHDKRRLAGSHDQRPPLAAVEDTRQLVQLQQRRIAQIRLVEPPTAGQTTKRQSFG